MEIKRDGYLNRMLEADGNGFVKVITGIRRCGKSYLMNTLFANELLRRGVKKENIIRFAFDSEEDLSSIGESLLEIKGEGKGVDPGKFLTFVSERTKGSGKYYLLLDEIGYLSSFETVLNGYLRKPNLELYVSGSNSHLLSKDIDTSFRGRGYRIDLRPLSFSEYHHAFGGDFDSAIQSYLFYGGLPLVCLSPREETKIAILQGLFSEIYLKDIQERHRVKNPAELEDLLDLLSSSSGGYSNPKKLSNCFKSEKGKTIGSSTIEKYIGYFENSFLLEKAKRYDVKGNKYLSFPCKYYFTDLGLRNARLSFRQVEENHLMEGLIYNELRQRGYAVDVGVVYVNEKNVNGNLVKKATEVDFVANLGSKRYYIQSAYSMEGEGKSSKEKKGFRNIPDSFRKIIVTRSGLPAHYDEEGFLRLSLREFLLDESKMDF